jgi:hypothetical protein
MRAFWDIAPCSLVEVDPETSFYFNKTKAKAVPLHATKALG